MCKLSQITVYNHYFEYLDVIPQTAVTLVNFEQLQICQN